MTSHIPLQNRLRQNRLTQNRLTQNRLTQNRLTLSIVAPRKPFVIRFDEPGHNFSRPPQIRHNGPQGLATPAAAHQKAGR
jgi:hypothetical protein